MLRISCRARTNTSAPTTMKFHRAALLAIPRAQGEATSQIPSIMLIHSSWEHYTCNKVLDLFT